MAASRIARVRDVRESWHPDLDARFINSCNIDIVWQSIGLRECRLERFSLRNGRRAAICSRKEIDER
jgi:hypothetical protein